MKNIFYGTGIFNSKLEQFFYFLKGKHVHSVLDYAKILISNTGEVGIETAQHLINFNYKNIANSIYTNLIKTLSLKNLRSDKTEIILNSSYFENNIYRTSTLSLTKQEIMFYYDWLAGHTKKNLLKWYGEQIINDLVGKNVNPFIEKQAELLYEQINLLEDEYKKESRFLFDEYTKKMSEIQKESNSLHLEEINKKLEILKKEHYDKIDKSKEIYENNLVSLQDKRKQLFS